MKILIVDDHALIRDALQGVLKKLQRGVIVLEASDSKQAMDIIAGNPDINLILLDLTLPDRDGLSVLAATGFRRERLHSSGDSGAGGICRSAEPAV